MAMPGEKTDDQKDDSAGGTDGGKSIVIRKVADDPCIHHVIQLLKQLTEKQRNGKGQNTAGESILLSGRCCLYFLFA